MLITEKKLRNIIRGVLLKENVSTKNLIYVPQGNWNNIIRIIKKNFADEEAFQNLTATKLAKLYNNKTLKVGEALDVPELIQKINGDLDGIPKVYSRAEVKSIESQEGLDLIFNNDATGLDKAVSHMSGKDEPSLFEKYLHLMDKLYVSSKGDQKAKSKIQNLVSKVYEKYEDNQDDPSLFKLIEDAKQMIDLDKFALGQLKDDAEAAKGFRDNPKAPEAVYSRYKDNKEKNNYKDFEEEKSKNNISEPKKYNANKKKNDVNKYPEFKYLSDY